MKKRYHKESNLNAISKLAVGTGISLFSILTVSVIFGAIAMAFPNVTGMIPPFSILTIVFSALLSGALVSRFVSNGNTGLSVLIFLMCALLLMLIGTIVGKGTLPISVFLNFLIFLGTATLSSYIFRKRERAIRRRFMN